MARGASEIILSITLSSYNEAETPREVTASRPQLEVPPEPDPGVLAPVPEYFNGTRLSHSPPPWATLTGDGLGEPSHSHKVGEVGGQRLADEGVTVVIVWERGKGRLWKGDSGSRK